MFSRFLRSRSSICTLLGLASLLSRCALAVDQGAFMWETFQETDAGFSSLSPEQQTISQDTSSSAFEQLKAEYRKNTEAVLNQGSGQCNSGNIAIRREWGTMTADERRSFIAAFQCLLKMPGETDRSIAPGARNRLDDYVVGHIKYWPEIHFSPALFLWHRNMLVVLEKELREKCGYTAYMPYWLWPKTIESGISADPLFDNSDTSLSGDGDHRDDNCSCVTSGPFKDWTVNLGPMGGTACSQNSRDDALGYNRRCLERRMDQKWLANMTYDNIVQSIQGSNDVTAFARRVDTARIGLHALGHTFVGGLQGNIPAAASDAVFYVHHCMMDFMYSMWQAHDFNGRTFVIADPSAYEGIRDKSWGPVPHVGLDDSLPMGPALGNVTLRDAVSPTGGTYCYIYE